MEPDVPEETVDRVRELLREHRGKDNPISSSDINAEIGIDSPSGSQPNTRRIVRYLLVEEGLPVAGSNQGYYIVEREEELQDYLEYLDNKAYGIMLRKQAVKSAFSGDGFDPLG